MPENQLEKIQRLVRVRNHLKLTQAEMASVLGINRANLSAIENGRENRQLPNGTIYIIEKELGINPEWFETGEGEMLLTKRNPVLEAKPLRLADPYGYEATPDKIYKLPDESLIMQVPVIPYKAWASYLRGHSDPEFYDGLLTMPVPVDMAHKGTYLIFEVGGESMVNPGSRKCIWPGERIIGRDLQKDKWKYKLHYNTTDAWIIVHRERGIVIKEIIDHDVDGGKITLHSWNPDKNEHPDYVVSLDDCEQIFNVVDPFNRFG